MKKRQMDLGCTLFSLEERDESPLAILLHGRTGGYETPFMQIMIEQLVSVCHVSVLTFHFDFFEKKLSPSFDLCREQEQLIHVTSYACTLTSNRVALVGKSLGGVIGLRATNRYAAASRIASLVLLGWPIALGNPPRLEMLSGQATAPFSALEEYQDLLTSIEMPVHVIQGGDDDLGSIPDCEEAIRLCRSATLDIVPRADHGFCVNGKPVFLACASMMIPHLRKDLSL